MKIAFIMDSLESIKHYKDSTVAMILAAQKRHWQCFYLRAEDLFIKEGAACARLQVIHVDEQQAPWYNLQPVQNLPLAELDVILMRSDPPISNLYINATQILDFARQQGVLVANDPSALRDANEKLFAMEFPQCAPPSLVSANAQLLSNFVIEQGDVIFKPLNAMGGRSIFRVKQGDANLNVILETITDFGHELIMAQRFIPEISQGDKRILIVDGEVVPYALARIPAQGENRGNIAAGGTGVGVELSPRDHWICQQVIPTLRQRGLLFTGLDVIGDFLTEINVTSPTCIRELDAQYGLDIAGDLMTAIEKRVANG
jgi:glutathione synthase